MKVILISGKAQNGKDTIAAMLKKKLEEDRHPTLIVHYADLLKFICEKYFDWDGNKDEQGRRLLQYVGTDIVRKQNPSLWVDFVVLMLKYFGKHWDYVVIPDCRFPNEIDDMRLAGFSTVHLRVKRTGFKSPLTEEQQKHPSEIALDNIRPDYYIDNNSSLEILNKRVNSWVDCELYRIHAPKEYEQITFDELLNSEV